MKPNVYSMASQAQLRNVAIEKPVEHFRVAIWSTARSHGQRDRAGWKQIDVLAETEIGALKIAESYYRRCCWIRLDNH